MVLPLRRASKMRLIPAKQRQPSPLIRRIQSRLGPVLDIPAKADPILNGAQTAFRIHSKHGVVLAHGNPRLLSIYGRSNRLMFSSWVWFAARAILSAAMLASLASSSFSLLTALAASSAALL